MMAAKKAPVRLRTTESALSELSEELGISEADIGGKVGEFLLPTGPSQA